MSVRSSLAVLAACSLPLSVLATPGAGTAAPAPSAAPSAAPQPADVTFERTATFPVFQNLPAGADPAEETVAEISTVTPDGNTLIYTDAAGRRIGFLDISDPDAPRGAGTLDLGELGDAEDSPTSVAAVGEFVLVVVDTSAYGDGEPAEGGETRSGRLDVVRVSDHAKVASIDLGGQPDSIAISPDGAYAAVAIENQRNETLPADGGGEEADLPQAPAGFVQVIELAGQPTTWQASPVAMTEDDGSALGSFEAAGVDTPSDPEPEYVDVNDENKLVVTLQENNGVVVVDLATRSIEKVFSAGSATVRNVDATKDATFNPVDTVSAPREPDSVQWVGPGLVATANEGDWKGGTRGWTIFDAATGDVVWDAGNSFEKIATRHGLFNNDRAAKKGPEPEGLAFDSVGGTPYAFVGSERSNFVAVYDMSDPRRPVFRQALPTTNGPEGLLPVPGRDLLAVSSETDDSSVGVRATVGLYRLQPGAPRWPSIVSATGADGQPVGWTALGALSAAPGDPGTLWAASDVAAKPGRIYRVSTSATPATITGALQVREPGGALASVDIEGLYARPGGGFWIASEGSSGASNKLMRLDDEGTVEQTVSLPADVASHIGKWGLEGVTATGTGNEEVLYVALQRPLWSDPAAATGPLDGDGVTRIGRYQVASDSWSWFGYQLEPTATDGDWMGLSEITAIDADTLAVIERDKLNGPAAKVKRIYTVDLSGDGGAEEPVMVEKRLAHDVLPDLVAQRGWTQEKLEGLAVGADHQVYVVTDNDGLKDSTGETQLLRLGTSSQVFSGSVASSTALELSRTTASWGTQVTARITVSPDSSGGTVTLSDGDQVLGSAELADGTATIRFRAPRPLRTHRLTATWPGTASVAGSTSSPARLRVLRRDTTISLSAPSRATAKHAVVLAATIGPRTAGGWVEFTAKGRRVARAWAKQGSATARVRLPHGRVRVAARYLGNQGHAASRSTPKTVVVR